MSLITDLTRILVSWLYSVLLTLSLPFLYLRLFIRSRKNPEYRRRWLERLGFFVFHKHKPTLWVHAVSVGEVVAAAPLIQSLQKEFQNYSIVVTTTTPTGAAQLKKIFKDSVFHLYFPFDLPFCWHQFIKRIKPSICIIMETEIWPNLLNKLKQKQIPVIIANGCLSEKSYAGYQKAKFVMQNMLAGLNYVAAQTEIDAKKFISLGVNPNQLSVVGNLKFDVNLNQNPQDLTENTQVLKSALANRQVFIAASTHVGEEALILSVYKALKTKFQKLLLILVPRHPERFDQVAEQIKKQDLNYNRRTKDSIPAKDTEVFLVDTMGELPLFYGISNIAFVGGSFVNIGGHNILEPAALSLPILVGPYTQDINEIADLFKKSSALIQVSTEMELISVLKDLLSDNNKCNAMGVAAKQLFVKNQGATQKTVELIRNLIIKSDKGYTNVRRLSDILF